METSDTFSGNYTLQMCIEKDPKALAALYTKYYSFILNIAGRYSTQEKEDICHETFEKVMTNLQNFRGTGSLDGFIYRITVNTALQTLKKKSPVFLESVEGLTNYSYLPYYDDFDLRDNIKNLPRGYRNVFILFSSGYSHKEIASRLNISEGTSKSQYYHARNRLKKAITSV